MTQIGIIEVICHRVQNVPKYTQIRTKIKGRKESFPHTPNRIYATAKNGELKYLSLYDENRNQIKSIDFDHAFNGVKPRVHFNMDHDKNSPGIPPSESDWAMISKIKRNEVKIMANNNFKCIEVFIDGFTMWQQANQKAKPF
ncbi:MAG: hypothetical protein PUC66_04035 [Erysipelotrichaceae bacterium]|nr:hypothetical protein [Erysipelotrichaceae bacterium]